MENKLNPNLFKSVMSYYSDYKPSVVAGLKEAIFNINTEVIVSKHILIKITFSIKRYDILENQDEGIIFMMENQFLLKDSTTLSKDDIYLMISFTHQTLLNFKPKESLDNIGTLFPSYPCPKQEEVQDAIDFVFDSLK